MKTVWKWITIFSLVVVIAAIILIVKNGTYYSLTDQQLLYNQTKELNSSWYTDTSTLPELVIHPFMHWHQADTKLVEMIVAIEDRRFRNHPGVDVIALGRVVINNIRSGEIMWASTIDQQVIKLLEQAYSRTRQQKIHEIASSLLLQDNGKDNILTTYLNLLPFPYGRQWIQEGCLLLFWLPCTSLTNYQRLFLIATYQTGNNPFTEKWFASIRERTNLLCSQWKKKNNPQIICEWTQITPQTKEDLSYLPVNAVYDPTLVDLIRQEVNSGDSVFNVSLTEEIDRILESTTSWRESIHGNDCCVMIVDNKWSTISQNTCRSPEDDDETYVNGCFQKRQVGSLMKPFVYLYALWVLDQTMDDRIVDEEVSFELPHGGVYKPQNFDLSFHGDVSLAEALASSLNIPAVKLLHQAWVEWYFPFYNRLRIIAGEDTEMIAKDSEQFNAEQLWLSVALWTYELSPYQAIGIWRLIFPQAVVTPSTTENNQRFSSLSSLRSEVTNVLADGSYRIHGFVHPERFTFPWRAIKTGTSRHYVDGWMCGVKLSSTIYESRTYAPGLTMCVWMWNYQWDPMDAAWADSAGILWWLVEEILQ